MYLRGFKNWADLGLIKSFTIKVIDETQLDMFEEEKANNNKNIQSKLYFCMEIESIKGKRKMMYTARGKPKRYASIDTAFADALKIDSSLKTLFVEVTKNAE